MRIGIISDPFEEMDKDGDSTFAIALEAENRGYNIWSILPQHIAFRSQRVFARGRKIFLRDVRKDASSLNSQLDARFNPHSHVAFDDWQELRLDRDFDVILMRQDPPFDMSYVSITHFLEQVNESVMVLNHPAAVRNAPEKISPLKYLGFHPDTHIVFDYDDITSAIKSLGGQAIIKPLFGNGGEGVVLVEPGNSNTSSIIELLRKAYPRQPLVVQQYLPEVEAGDKRVLLINGNVAGAFNRLPAAGENRANLHVGGIAQASELTANELKICETLSDWLRRERLFFVGIDLIGEKLTEINVTSPTGIRELKRLGGPDLAVRFWNELPDLIH